MSFNKLNDMLSGKQPEAKLDENMSNYHKEVLEHIHGKKPDSTEAILKKLEDHSQKPDDEARNIKLSTRHPLDWKKINRKLSE